MAGQKSVETLKSAGNQPDLSSRARRRSLKIFSGGLGGHQEFLVGDMRCGRSIGDKA
jgi:hypothetical protein